MVNGGTLKIPDFFFKKAVILRVNSQLCIIRKIHQFRSPAPIIDFEGIEPGFVH